MAEPEHITIPRAHLLRLEARVAELEKAAARYVACDDEGCQYRNEMSVCAYSCRARSELCRLLPNEGAILERGDGNG